MEIGKKVRNYVNNLTNYLKIIKCPTPSKLHNTQDSGVQTRFRRIKDVCKKMNYLDHLTFGDLKETPTSSKSNKKFIIVNIANPNECDMEEQVDAQQNCDSVYMYVKIINFDFLGRRINPLGLIWARLV